MDEEQNRFSVAPTIEDKDIYKTVLDTRNFEITLFWQRSNYFLVLNSALAVGLYNLKSGTFEALLTMMGLLASVLWFFVNLGSKFWQSRWEHRLQVLEKQIAPSLDLFGASAETVKSDVKESLLFNKHQGIQKLLDIIILMKPSVSYCMTLLSLVFVVAWFFMLCFIVFFGGKINL